MNRNIAVIFATGLLIAACTPMAQRPAVDPALGSGVTSSNGGGTRQTGNTNSTAIGAGGAVTTPNNSRGSAY